MFEQLLFDASPVHVLFLVFLVIGDSEIEFPQFSIQNIRVRDNLIPNSARADHKREHSRANFFFVDGASP